MAKRDVIHETGSTWYIATPPEEDRATATGDLHTKFREDQSSYSRDMLADKQTDKQTDRRTDRQTGDHNTPHPYLVKSIISLSLWSCTSLVHTISGRVAWSECLSFNSTKPPAGSRGRAPDQGVRGSWTPFCIITARGVGQFVLESVFCKTKKFVGCLGHAPGSASAMRLFGEIGGATLEGAGSKH